MTACAVRMLRSARPSPDADGDLLTRYLDHADAAAFTELVHRYAGMVRGVCRRVLGPTADADDAFQAAFLVLVRKARTVSPRSRVGHFLYGVAYRTAVHARSVRAARSVRHHPWSDMPATPADTVDPDQLAALDEELAKLPEVYRAAVVLCELDGLNLKEAAKRLNIPEGTLASRLARGRKRLAERLRSRGLVGLLAAAVGASAASARVPAKLLQAVLAHSTEPAAGVAVELAHGVMKVMLFTKLKTLTKAAVVVLLLGGLLVLPMTGTAAPTPPDAKPAARRAPVTPPAADQKKLEELW